MNEVSDSPELVFPSVPEISNWYSQLEGAVLQDRVLWTPPDFARLDLWLFLPTSLTESRAVLESLLGEEGQCVLNLPSSTREEAALGSGEGILQKLRRFKSPEVTTVDSTPKNGEAGHSSSDHFPEVHLGVSYLWVPPGFSGEGASPAVLLPLALLPVEVIVNPFDATVQLRVSGNAAGCRLQPNPVFLRWWETTTRRPSGRLLEQAPADPWQRLNWLASLASEACGGGPSPDPFQAASRFPRLDELPFVCSIFPSITLGRFPVERPLWQSELEKVLSRTEPIPGPLGWLLGDDSIAERSRFQPPVAAPACDRLAGQAETPALAEVLERTQSSELSVLQSPLLSASFESAAALIFEAVVRQERVLVITDSSMADRLSQVLNGQGLHGNWVNTTESNLGGPALRRELLSRRSEPRAEVAPEPRSATYDFAASERRFQVLLAELATAARALHTPGPEGVSFSQLSGEWLDLFGVVPPLPKEPAVETSLSELATHQETVHLVLQQSSGFNYSRSPWRRTLAEPTEASLARSGEAWEEFFKELELLATVADEAGDSGGIPFVDQVPLAEQVETRLLLAQHLDRLVGWDRPHFAARIANASLIELDALQDQLETLQNSAREMEYHPLDPELWARLNGEAPTLGAITAALKSLEAPAAGWWPWSSNSPPSPLLQALKLTKKKADRERGAEFLRGVCHRLQILQMTKAWLQPGGRHSMADDRLQRDWEGTGAILDLAKFLHQPSMSDLREPTLDVLRHLDRLPDFVQSLQRCRSLLQSVTAFEAQLKDTQLFLPAAIERWRRRWNYGETRQSAASAWRDQAVHLPAALAFQKEFLSLPKNLQALVDWHAGLGNPPEISFLAIQRGVAGAELNRLRARIPGLRNQSGTALGTVYAELAEIVQERRRQIGFRFQQRFTEAASGTATPESPDDLLSGRTLVQLSPVWIATSSQVLELFAPVPFFDLAVVLPAPNECLAEILPTFTRTARVVVLSCPELQPAAELEVESELGPGLLATLAEMDVPNYELPIRADAASSSPSYLAHPTTPNSRVHLSLSPDHAQPSRVAAAVGALLRNDFGVSSEVHWADEAGVVDLALWNFENDSAPRTAWQVDLPEPSDEFSSAVGEGAQKASRLKAAGWHLTHLWAPDLLPDPRPVLATMLAEAGIRTTKNQDKPLEEQELPPQPVTAGLTP